VLLRALAPASSWSSTGLAGQSAVQMVGYGHMHKQMLKKEWEAFYVNYDLLQHMLQRYIESPGQ
jgi:hypothetical protein